MNLRLDVLLGRLREDASGILQAIDNDPLLLKKTSGDLVLANAGLELYTPQLEHQLYAKGIVYQRDPYRLVSLPLIKIYNLGEREVNVADLAVLLAEDVRLRFLRKLDGSLLQVFAHAGRLWFTTRGILEGSRSERGAAGFDFLGTARNLLQRQAPHLLADPDRLGERTLLFELLHPQAPHITQYGDREELVLIAALDRQRLEYLAHDPLTDLAQSLGLSLVDALAPPGDDIGQQIQGLLDLLRGTDQEGSVLNFERQGQVIYRVKVKTPEYLRLMQALAHCSYARAEEILDAQPNIRTWEAFEAHLRHLGNAEVPEEVLPYYRPHFETYLQYEVACAQLRTWAEQRLAQVLAGLDPALVQGTPAFRKAFAQAVAGTPGASFLFTALDGRLDRTVIRRTARDLAEARQLLAQLQGQSAPSENSR